MVNTAFNFINWLLRNITSNCFASYKTPPLCVGVFSSPFFFFTIFPTLGSVGINPISDLGSILIKKIKQKLMFFDPVPDSTCIVKNKKRVFHRYIYCISKIFHLTGHNSLLRFYSPDSVLGSRMTISGPDWIFSNFGNNESN